MECTKTKLDKIVNETKEQLSKKVPISTLQNKRGIVNADELIKGVWDKFGKQLQKIASAELHQHDDGSPRNIFAEKVVKHGTGDEHVSFKVGKIYTHKRFDDTTPPYVRAIYVEVNNNCKRDYLELAKKDIGRLHEVVEAYIKMFKAFIEISEQDAKKGLADRIKADKFALAILPDAKLHYVTGQISRSNGFPVFHYRTNYFEMSVNIDTKEVALELLSTQINQLTPEMAADIVKLHSKTLERLAAERARHEAKIRAEQQKKQAVVAK